MIKQAFLIGTFALSLHAHAADRVLMVVSSAGTAEDPESGYEFDELSQAYRVFVDNGLEVDIASPSGCHPVSEKINEQWVFNQRFLADENAMSRITSYTHYPRLERALEEDAFNLSPYDMDYANLHGDPRWAPLMVRAGRLPEALSGFSLDVKLPNQQP